MDEHLLNVLESVAKLEKTESKEGLIEFITDEFEIPTATCEKCGTDSIVYLESESQLYCLYCDDYVPEHLFADCECGGQGIIENVCDSSGICEETAVCLKCQKEISKEVCFHDGETGYNFPHVAVDVDENGEDHYEPVCPRCYDLIYDNNWD